MYRAAGTQSDTLEALSETDDYYNQAVQDFIREANNLNEMMPSQLSKMSVVVEKRDKSKSLSPVRHANSNAQGSVTDR